MKKIKIYMSLSLAIAAILVVLNFALCVKMFSIGNEFKAHAKSPYSACVADESQGFSLKSKAEIEAMLQAVEKRIRDNDAKLDSLMYIVMPKLSKKELNDMEKEVNNIFLDQASLVGFKTGVRAVINL